jgi:SAM-dependent methyltransferase/uncharacterized protein YbaR (Trm112 family)
MESHVEITSLRNKKLAKLLSCPNCKQRSLKTERKAINCEACGEVYGLLLDTPILIKKDSPVLEWYEPKMDSRSSGRVLRKLMNLYWWLRPEARLWTKRSQEALQRLIEEVNPDSDDVCVVLIGAGFESVYRRILNPYGDIIRIGLASRGDVDLFCDVCDIPLPAQSLDLILSSSVLEHVYDPERAVREMFRTAKPGGYVYAEIPFMRAFHMIPVDYQRYTISGIEELFKRHGFKLVEKGICSGPFTASVLFFIDFFSGLFSFNKYIKAIVTLILSMALHPIKYLDRLVENAAWAEITACNFYYIGKK